MSHDVLLHQLFSLATLHISSDAYICMVMQLITDHNRKDSSSPYTMQNMINTDCSIHDQLYVAHKMTVK